MTTFHSLCQLFSKIEGTASRLEIQALLSSYIKKVDPKHWPTLFYLCTGVIYPNYENKELNIGESQLIKIIAEMTMKNVKAITLEFHTEGDLGSVLMKHKINTLIKVTKEYKIDEILKTFRDIAEIEGKDSNLLKARQIKKVLVGLTEIEKKYFVRLCEGKLKIGLAVQTVLISFGMVMFENVDYVSEEISDESVSEDEEIVDNVSEDKNDDSSKDKKLKSSNSKSKKRKVTRDDPINTLKFAYDKCCDIETLFKVFRSKGLCGLENMGVYPSKPFRSMLCNPLNNFNVPFDSFICEVKYDGERIQIHKIKNEIFTYSRNGENSLLKYPEIVEIMNRQEIDCVLDAEIVAMVENKVAPFNVLAKRKKKNTEQNHVKICVFVFDILSINGRSLLDDELRTRRKILIENIKIDEDIRLSEIISTYDEENNDFTNYNRSKTIVGEDENNTEEIVNEENNEIDQKKNKSYSEEKSQEKVEEKSCESNDKMSLVEYAFNETVQYNEEGILIKNLDSEYIPNKRSTEWLKLKKDYLAIADTFDLIVMGAYYGKGKRTGWFGGFLMGCVSKASENDENPVETKYDQLFEPICRLGTGFDEKLLADLKQNLKITNSKPNEYKCAVEPDVWVEPGMVFEVNAAEVSTSPVYTVSLRFPRFVRVRDDKNISDVTPLYIIKNMMVNQSEN